MDENREKKDSAPYPEGTYSNQSGYNTCPGGQAYQAPNPNGPTVMAANGYYRYNEQNIPREVRRWNWGAFMFNWIWGCGNGAYLTLLMFVPLLNIVWIFICGALGNKWAWKSGKFKDLETFLTVQKTWNTAGLIVFIISIAIVIIEICFGVLFASYFGASHMFNEYSNYKYY